MWIFGALTLFTSLYWLLEYLDLERERRRINLRIHVNGTRGKSSTTRLIAAALRAGGRKTWAKTTGTEPKVIFEDGSEILVPRRGKANIIEQTRIIRAAARKNVEAIVMECMALRPDFQWIETHRIIKPHIGVITNVRPDHLDVMGPTVDDVALALSSTIPENGILVTAENNYLALFKEIAESRNSRIISVKEEDVADDEMKGFSYVEHKENVAIALAIANFFGIEREEALKEMYRAIPDPGALNIFRINERGKSFDFVNAFAANDPASILILWNKLKERWGKRVIVMNCRRDRIDRSKQLGELLAKEMDAEKVIVTGALTRPFIKRAVSNSFPQEKIIDLEGLSPEEVFNEIVDIVPNDSLVFGMGNIVTFGEELVEIMRKRSKGNAG
jgi:poly-gamma-glutamate synthase PgsB/CapB